MAISVKLGERKVWKVNVGVASTGTKDHTKLENRNAADQHPINSISGLEKALSQKAPSSHQHKKEDITDFPKSLPASDVYDWAKQPQKPSYTASEVKARPDNWMPSASEVGARPNTWLPTPEQIGAAPALDWSHLKWYVMGDSLTAQDNAFTNKRYYDFVQEKTGIQIIVDGIGGTGYGAGASNSESYYDRVQNIPDDVDIVTIFGSGNDIRFAESANMEIYNTLSWMALNKPGLRVIVVPPSPWKDYNKREDPWKAYCDRLQACASVCNFRYVSDMYDCPPFNPNFTGHMELFFTTDPEGIHPDENGHKALAPYFYNALLEELALDESVVVSPGGSGGSGGSGGAVDIPTALPNPHKLTFTGAVTAEYDGSEAVEVKIPEGGSGGGIEVTGASVGQTIVVKAVDDNGKPTEWETRDFPDSGQNGDYVGVEPAEDDIPKVYFTGTLPTNKAEQDVRLTMHYISKTADFTYPVTLKVQGSSSVNYPKKNFTLKLYKDSTYEKKQKLAFKNWGEMNKFVLKAHWVDHSHVRNVGTAKIWGKIVKSRPDYASLPEELRNSPNNGATDGFTVKVFCNGVYQGLYEWIVPKDKLFGQDKDIATHSILNSELNNHPVGAFATATETPDSWSEELQDSMSSEISTSFASLITFVAESSDSEFVANAENYFDVQSVIDYNILARIFCIVDNLCRNQIFFTYDGVKWYEGCWDVDGILGLPPAGGAFFKYDTKFQEGYLAYKNFGITNLLYQRVETLFFDRFKARYAELRAGVLSVENIIEVYERLTDVITSYDGLLAEDYAVTTAEGKFINIPYVSENNIQQIRNFVAKRLPYMDSVIESMTPPVHCTGISLSAETLTFTAEGTQTMTATVTPDGCTDAMVWASSNPSVATISVDGTVCTVAAVANGNSTISVTCGEYSASCFVAVSGIAEPVPCTGITLDFAELTLGFIGDTKTLTATLTPSDTTDVIVWTSDNESIATVENGVVTSVGYGDCTITATCGNHSASCIVSVSEAVVLPDGYTALQYIEATGKQYIDSGIVPSASTGAEYKVRITEFNTYASHVLSCASAKFFFPAFLNSGNGINVIRLSFPSSSQLLAEANLDYTVSAFVNDDTYTINNTTFTAKCGTAPETTTLGICALTSACDARFALKGYIYYITIYENGTIVKRYIPCTNADGVAGLYDLIAGTFHDSGTTTAFVAGPTFN